MDAAKTMKSESCTETVLWSLQYWKQKSEQYGVYICFEFQSKLNKQQKLLDSRTHITPPPTPPQIKEVDAYV